jgi:hypothetical protein
MFFYILYMKATQKNLHHGSVNDSVVFEGLEQIEVVLKQQLQRRLGNGQRDVLKERVKSVFSWYQVEIMLATLLIENSEINFIPPQ